MDFVDDMYISVQPQGGAVAVVAPVGRLDLQSAGILKERIGRTVETGHNKLVVDLASVTFVDSSGLGALIAGLKATRLAGGDLRLARPTDQASAILKLTTLDRILRPYSSVEAALSGY